MSEQDIDEVISKQDIDEIVEQAKQIYSIANKQITHPIARTAVLQAVTEFAAFQLDATESQLGRIEDLGQSLNRYTNPDEFAYLIVVVIARLLKDLHSDKPSQIQPNPED